MLLVSDALSHPLEDGRAIKRFGDFLGEGPQILEQSVILFRDHPPTMHGLQSGHPRDFQEAKRHFWGMQNSFFERCKGTEQCSKFPTFCMMSCIKTSKDTCHRLTLPHRYLRDASAHEGGKDGRQQHLTAAPQSLSLLLLDCGSLAATSAAGVSVPLSNLYEQ